jgi:hypothetical protein
VSKRQSLEALQQMYRAGTAIPLEASNPYPSGCYLCMKPIPAGQGYIWSIHLPVRTGRLLCTSCDRQVRAGETGGAGE